ncbi:MAG TPA: ROK family protein [Bacteroidales bacterium]
MRQIIIGCDVGGSHITTAAVDLKTGSLINESMATQKVDNQAAANDILENWTIAIKRSISLAGQENLSGIGMAMPGPFDYEKGIALFTGENAKFQELNGINVAQELDDKLALPRNVSVRVMNDATAFAVGEAWQGKASGTARSVSITLGTGFGSAFIDHGIPVIERDDVPKQGCVWHLPLNESIADDYFSTRWFIKRFAEKSGWYMAGVKEIADRVVADPRALEVFSEFGQNLGLFLGPWLKKFKANTLVIGGNISSAYHLFDSHLAEALKSLGVSISIQISELKENAALIGSARLFDDDFWTGIKPLLSKM